MKKFEELFRAAPAEKAQKLYSLWSTMRSLDNIPKEEPMTRWQKLYEGQDETHFNAMIAKFGSADGVIPSYKNKEIVDGIRGHLISLFVNENQVYSLTPVSVGLSTQEAGRIWTNVTRYDALIKKQVKASNLVSAMSSAIQNSLIHTSSFIEVNWDEAVFPELVETEDAKGQRRSTVKNKVISKFNFEVLRPNNVFYPQVSSWDKVPYLCVRKTISGRAFNSRFPKFSNMNELGGASPTSSERNEVFGQMSSRVPGTNTLYSVGADDKIDLFEFYFYTGKFTKKYTLARQVLNMKHGIPVHGQQAVVDERNLYLLDMKYPIVPVVLNPSIGRVQGESFMDIINAYTRVINECDNLALFQIRKNVPYMFYKRTMFTDQNALLNRKYGTPIPLTGNPAEAVSFIQPPDTSASASALAQYFKGHSDGVSGQSDILRGNVGASSRISGVSTLVNLAGNRFSTMVIQLTDVLTNIFKIMHIYNRAFMPVWFKQYAANSEQDVESDITIPEIEEFDVVLAKTRVMDVDKESRALMFALQMSMQQQSMDSYGLMERYLQRNGIVDAARYIKPNVDKRAMFDTMVQMGVGTQGQGQGAPPNPDQAANPELR